MANTAIVIDARYQAHDTGPGHPERPQRIGALLPVIESVAKHFRAVAARSASGDELALVHDGAYVDDVAATADKPWFAFDPDTPTSAQSFATACLAAGGVLALIDAIMAGTADNGFAFVRPPGHHAERHRAMGFCLFNNVAVGAAYARQRYGLTRILVVDWDVHHGNGTQHLFEDDPGVLYVSTHQDAFYPGTGALDEVGCGDGEGFTVNLPLPAGCGDAEYAEVFQRIVEPIAYQYEPQLVLISAGFDAHQRDPLGGMQLSDVAFQAMTRSLLGVARAHAGGRCAAVLEGGYDLQAICSASVHVLAELKGRAEPLDAAPSASRASGLVDHLVAMQRRYWKL